MTASSIIMTDTVVLAIIGVLTILAKEYFDHQRYTRAATAAEQVRVSLEQTTISTSVKLDDLAKVSEATHILVNSAMSAALKDNAEIKMWRAEQAKGTPEYDAYLKSAEKAEMLYKEHLKKQEAVDKQPGTDDQKRGVRS